MFAGRWRGEDDNNWDDDGGGMTQIAVIRQSGHR